MYVGKRSFILLPQSSDPLRSTARRQASRLVPAAVRPSVESPTNYDAASLNGVIGSLNLWRRRFLRSRNKYKKSMQYGGNEWNVLEGKRKQALQRKCHWKIKWLCNSSSQNFPVSGNSFFVWRQLPGGKVFFYLCRGILPCMGSVRRLHIWPSSPADHTYKVFLSKYIFSNQTQVGQFVDFGLWLSDSYWCLECVCLPPTYQCAAPTRIRLVSKRLRMWSRSR
jgi:hypothetical protein